MSQILNLEPQHLRALKGTDAQFNVTVLEKWEVMTWSIGDFLVLTMFATDGSTIIHSDQFSATFCTASDTSCVEFTIHNVTRNQSGEITCNVLGTFGSQAQLTVEGKIRKVYRLQFELIYLLAFQVSYFTCCSFTSGVMMEVLFRVKGMLSYLTQILLFF